MTMRKYQGGMTMISWAMLAALIGFVGLFAFRLFPIYMNYYTVNSILTNVAKGLTENESPVQIRKDIGNFFDVNDVNNLKPDDIEIKPDPNTKALVMKLDYDSRTNFVANVDLVVHFSKTYSAAGH
jgi:hypothetical protein